MRQNFPSTIPVKEGCYAPINKDVARGRDLKRPDFPLQRQESKKSLSQAFQVPLFTAKCLYLPSGRDTLLEIGGEAGVQCLIALVQAPESRRCQNRNQQIQATGHRREKSEPSKHNAEDGERRKELQYAQKRFAKHRLIKLCHC